jgi:hypothetical protein
VTSFFRFSLLALIVVLLVLLPVGLRQPSNERDWVPEQAVLAHTSFAGQQATITNVRNYSWRTLEDYDVGYYNETYDIAGIERVYLLQEDFGNIAAIAHTMLVFHFEDGKKLAISVEARKTPDEEYSPLKGLMREYELMYVIGDERDLLDVRTNVRNNTVRTYPLRMTQEQAARLLRDMLQESNALEREPQFYNTFTSTCTTNLVKHANRVTPGRVPLRKGVFLPGYAAELAYDIGLIDTNLSFTEAREYYRIS